MRFGDIFDRSGVIKIVIATLASVAGSVALAAVAMVAVFGTDLEAATSVSLAFKFGLTAAALVPALICPFAHFPILVALHHRDRARLELQHLVRTDPLTRLSNRRGFNELTEAAMAKSIANGQSMAVMMLDIDFFKKVNDNFGHDFGDAALVRVADILRDEGRKENFVVARQGGEEFIAFLLGRTEADVLAIAENVRAACSVRPIEHDSRSAFISVSIGVAVHPDCGAALSWLAGRADAALYEAKRNGRDRVVLAGGGVALASAA